MYAPTIMITDRDLERLRRLLDQHDTQLAEALDAELHRAVVVPQRDVPADVVTMNSEITYEDCETGTRRTIRIVFPKDADASAGRISILAPIAAALLGLRTGQEIEWRVPKGMTRLRLAEIRYQPEAAGDLDR